MSINDLSIYQKVDLLVSVDSDTFTLLCQTNKAFKEACSLENVYDQRCHKYFSDDILQLKYKYNMKWKEFYDRVTKFQKLLALHKIIPLTIPEEWLPQLDIDVINNADAYAIEGKVFELELCLLMGEEPDVDYGANWAAGRGHLDVLKLLKEYNILPDEDGFDLADENDYTEVTNWLMENNIISNYKRNVITLFERIIEKQTIHKFYNLTHFDKLSYFGLLITILNHESINNHIFVNAEHIKLPFIVNKNNIQQARDFVKYVVAKSKYNYLAPLMLKYLSKL